jgi:3'(2'), 5'-bisphosphate nucleotidase
VGSSLKLCYVAEGRADLYPRYAPTSEWDTAAGHAIVRAAGGEIYQADPDAPHTPFPLRYNKENLLNPWFVVRAW